jgi:thiamine monophosphate kinase
MSVNQPIDNEEAFIARYLAPLASGCLGTFGLEDDAAVLSLSPGEELVITTDAVAAGVHFCANDAPEALAVNVSDLAAKGARPLVYQMALSFPDIPDHQWMTRFTSGLAGAQKAFEIRLSGGDTDRRPGPLSITITAMGTVPMGKMIRRGGAAPDDVLFVTGTLGDGALGLLVRAGEPRANTWGLDTAGMDFLRPRVSSHGYFGWAGERSRASMQGKWCRGRGEDGPSAALGRCPVRPDRRSSRSQIRRIRGRRLRASADGAPGALR